GPACSSSNKRFVRACTGTADLSSARIHFNNRDLFNAAFTFSVVIRPGTCHADGPSPEVSLNQRWRARSLSVLHLNRPQIVIAVTITDEQDMRAIRCPEWVCILAGSS